jgi:hypothetical protein
LVSSQLTVPVPAAQSIRAEQHRWQVEADLSEDNAAETAHGAVASKSISGKSALGNGKLRQRMVNLRFITARVPSTARFDVVPCTALASCICVCL